MGSLQSCSLTAHTLQIEEVALVTEKGTKKRRGFCFVTFTSEDHVDTCTEKTFHMLNTTQVGLLRYAVWYMLMGWGDRCGSLGPPPLPLRWACFIMLCVCVCVVYGDGGGGRCGSLGPPLRWACFAMLCVCVVYVDGVDLGDRCGSL